MEQAQPDTLEEAPVISVTGRQFAIGALDRNATHYLNRELSWLSFNARVLSMARDPRVPLLERVKFLAIYSSNLDEFFQVRVAGLRDQSAAGVRRRTPDGRTPDEQLREIRRAVDRLEESRQHIFSNELLPQLRLQGITILRYAELSAADQKIADEYFVDQVFPILTPLAVDPGHPFPYISDLSLNLGVRVRRSGDDRARFARIKIPDTVHRLVPLSEPGSFLRVEDLIVANLDQLFPGLTVVEHLVFRVTRNADLNYKDEEADDLLEHVEMELRRRRLGGAVRLEIAASSGNSIRSLLVRELELEESDVFVESSLLAMVDLWDVLKLDRPDLMYKDFAPVVPYRIAERSGDDVDIFEVLRDQDLFVHHPYESFSATTQEFIRRAAVDPSVVAIKMTLYRTSSDSPIIRALVRAAEAGKQVAVLIELKARFDEEANIEWAKALEQAGVHVTYGLAGLKVHAKLTMVVRREEGRMTRYCHFGTGNYNQGTAKIYGDFGLLTASEQLGEQVAVLFNTLTGYGDDVVYPDLLVAPDSLRSGMEDLIRQEMQSENGRIILKTNSLIDARMIQLLYEASQAGVEINCIVRGVCGLRPGVPGLSDNIRVRSIIGRYLEHARIYWFANGQGPGKPSIYMGSADLMSRNLDRRVEALVQVDDETAVSRLTQIVDLNLADGLQTWMLQSDGSWHRDASEGRIDLHAAFEQDAIARRSPSPGH